MSKVKNIYNFTIGDLKSVKEFDKSKHYVKVISSNKKHNVMKYHEGLNADVLIFNNDPNETCVEGGLYFTTLEYLPEFCNYGTLVAEIKIPEDARIVLDPEGNKYRADKIEILKFWDMNDFLEHVGYVEITCSAYFNNLKNTRGLETLEKIEGCANFYNLEDATGLKNLRKIEIDANFYNLKDSRGLENLGEIGGSAMFNHLENATGLRNLEKIGGNATFNYLKDSKGLENLKEIDLNANFYGLKNARGLINLRRIGQSGNFTSLENSLELSNLKDIGYNLYLHYITSEQTN